MWHYNEHFHDICMTLWQLGDNWHDKTMDILHTHHLWTMLLNIYKYEFIILPPLCSCDWLADKLSSPISVLVWVIRTLFKNSATSVRVFCPDSNKQKKVWRAKSKSKWYALTYLPDICLNIWQQNLPGLGRGCWPWLVVLRASLSAQSREEETHLTHSVLGQADR